MTDKQILNQIRESEHFRVLCEAFKRMTELDLWLDSLDEDDPRSMDELSSDYYSILTKKLGLKDQLDVSHQTMREATSGKHVKYAEGISGLIHFLVPVHNGEQEIGFLRCGGMRDTYRGVLKFMNFSQELKDQDHDADKIAELELAFKKIPNIHGEDLAEATAWLADRAKEIDKEITEIKSAS
ncbi:MAG: hypothetical protein ACSHX6_00685 [Akkermansiaceae bacterium]